jgi:hypothetical protein
VRLGGFGCERSNYSIEFGNGLVQGGLAVRSTGTGMLSA